MDTQSSPLLTDLYQLAMAQAYLDNGENKTAVFELFVRRLPARRGFLMAAGLEQALDFLENLRFSPADIEWLATSRRCNAGLLRHLERLRFTGDVHAMPEGSVFFDNEPILRITAPLIEAQLVETRLMNLIHYQVLVASKAARAVLAAAGKRLVDFGLRRAHGAEAGLMAARASYIAGFAGTATVLAEQEFGIPSFGTMAHSFVQIHDDESTAFERFARSRPNELTLLIDTYDTEAATRKVVALARKLAADGIKVGAVRIDSGNLIMLSRTVRRILDEGGCKDVRIFVSGGLDEDDVMAILHAGAPIDGFGLGTSLTTSSDVPALDCVYKLEEYDGVARRKRSVGKETWPGRKQVWRRHGADGRMKADILTVETDIQEGEPLLHPVMQGGRRLRPHPTLTEIRARAARDLAALPEPLRHLEAGTFYTITVAPALTKLASNVDQRLAAHDRPQQP
ncbi:MAG: nicotinate phosphoribosyltransferase [Proteobacteria bacterium]|nr:nicotinate phosphoribosyltransferase [Pseudomonadota bacterium]